MDGKILEHIVTKWKEQSRNLNINVISSCDAIAEVSKREGLDYRFVVNLDERTCSCRAWQVCGLTCKHALAFITSISREKIEDHVDHFYSVEKFIAAYEGIIPAIPDKTIWPNSDHRFFMYPPLLKAIACRRRQNRYKSSAECGTSTKGKHQCPICHDYGHHWYTCEEGDHVDNAAMLAERSAQQLMNVLQLYTISTNTICYNVGDLQRRGRKRNQHQLKEVLCLSMTLCQPVWFSQHCPVQHLLGTKGTA
jgi:hypothetical protein